MRTVSEVARATGVTVRTLHHYDEIGLLVPAARSEAGYRLYADTDVERLLEIVLARELGFSLEEIRARLDDPDHDHTAALKELRERLLEQHEVVARRIEAIDRHLTRPGGTIMSDEDLKEVFGDLPLDDWAAEAEERWGDTDAWKESRRRTQRYTKDDWLTIKEEGAAVDRRLAELLGAGAAADSAEAMDAAEAHRRHIGRWFYDCSKDLHAAIAEMYVTDPRFTKTYEDRAEGLARFVRDAVVANAARSD